jgi:hypothetical protein
VGHRQRTRHAALELAVQVVQGGPGDRRALLALVVPGEAVHAVRLSDPHQLVVGRMERHLVDAVAKPVVGAQLGQHAVGHLTQLGPMGAA